MPTRVPCGTCGGKRRSETRSSTSDSRLNYVDPTKAIFAAATPSYEVVPSNGGRGKRFSTYQAAADYARRSGGTVRAV